MRMMGKLLFVPIALVVIGLGLLYSGHVITTITAKSKTTTAKPTTTTAKPTTTTAKPTTTTRRTTTWPYTTASPQSNLNGKMVTLSANGGISFFPPYFSDSTQSYSTRPYPTQSYSTRPYPTQSYSTRPYPTQSYSTRPYTTQSYSTRPYTTQSYSTRPYTTQSYSTRPYPTRHYPTRPYPTHAYHVTTYPPWTTAPPTSGVSVCVRFLCDFGQSSNIFTLSPASTTALSLAIYGPVSYNLYWNNYRYYNRYFTPNIRFWSNIGPDIWKRVCLTVDTHKNVAQVFSGSNFSIRKILPVRYVWSGEPVIEISGFDGQVTDVQMWDYPISYREIFNYMTSGVYGPYQGSILTWSNIKYSIRGNTLLEDTYGWQEKQPISRRGKDRGPKAERKNWKVFNESGRKERKRLSQL